MKPQIIDRYVYVKGKKISEATSKSNLDGNEILPLAYNDVNYNTTVDQISEYVDKVHDYLTTENYNDLKGQIDSERTNRQEADNELNRSIQDTKSELHSTISGVESELLGEVNDLQEQIDSINETGIAKGVTLDTAQTITGEKTFTTVPKSTADATEDTDLVNKKYVDNIVKNVYIINLEDLQEDTLDESIINGIKDAYNNDQPIYLKSSNTDVGFAPLLSSIKDSKIHLIYNTSVVAGQGEGHITFIRFDINTDTRTVKMFAVDTDLRSEGDGDRFLADDGLYYKITKANLGLGNVDNTSDLNKPISNATKEYITEQGFARTSDIPEGLEIGETTGTAFDGGRGKTVEDVIGRLYTGYYDQYVASAGTIDGIIKFTNNNPDFVSVSIHSVNLNKDIPNVSDYRSTIGSATTTNAGVMSAADKQKLDNIPTLTTSGDGTKYLSDNGTYKTIETPDLSNYLTEDDKTELETEIGDLSENVNGQITELQKKDSTIEGNVTNLTETVNTINDTVSGLDGKYLPLTGGTVSGNLTITGTTDVAKIKHSAPVEIQANSIKIRRTETDRTYYTELYCSSNTNEGGINVYRSEGDAIAGIRFKRNMAFIESQGQQPGKYAGPVVTTDESAMVCKIRSITQSAYDGLDSKDANTLYIITE